MRKAAKETIPIPEIQETLKSLGDIIELADASYVIVDTEKKGIVERLIEPYGHQLELRPLREILLNYHNISEDCFPQILRFEDWNTYKNFFGEEIPRDLLAVWDCKDERWRLCIGTMVGESDPTAVEMICTTEKRPLKNLPWATLDGKLRDLFCEDPSKIEDCVGITRERL